MTTYQKDFHAWCYEQAEVLAKKQFQDLDIENLIEELIDVGNSLSRELESRLRILFIHLLKWKYQEQRRGFSWQRSIKEQRRRIKKRLDKTPSLKSKLLEISLDAYEDALFDASEETGLSVDVFPKKMFFTIEQALTDDWFPE